MCVCVCHTTEWFSWCLKIETELIFPKIILHTFFMFVYVCDCLYVHTKILLMVSLYVYGIYTRSNTLTGGKQKHKYTRTTHRGIVERDNLNFVVFFLLIHFFFTYIYIYKTQYDGFQFLVLMGILYKIIFWDKLVKGIYLFIFISQSYMP